MSKKGLLLKLILIQSIFLFVSSCFPVSLQGVQTCIPFLIGHLKDAANSDVILNILLEIAVSDPAALGSFLPMLKEIGERFPYLVGQTARIFGAVGHVDEVSLAFVTLFSWALQALNPLKFYDLQISP